MLTHSIQYSCLLDPHDFYRSSQRHNRWLTQALPAVGTVASVDATSCGQKSEDWLKMRSGQALALQANGFASGTVSCSTHERPFTFITVIDQLAAHHSKGTA